MSLILNLFTRGFSLNLFFKGAPSPTPNGPPPLNFTATFKSVNIFAQLFDPLGNAPPTPEPEDLKAEEKNENENGNEKSENANEDGSNEVNNSDERS
jgi:hypothetical protein